MSKEVIEHPIDDHQISRFVRQSERNNLPRLICDASHVAWKYRSTTAVENTGVSKESNSVADEISERLWLTYRDWVIDGRAVVACFPNDLLIDEDARSLRELVTLIRHSFNTGIAKSNFLYHLSNPNSDDLYRTMFKKVPIFEYDFSVFVVKPWRLLLKLIVSVRGGSLASISLDQRSTDGKKNREFGMQIEDLLHRRGDEFKALLDGFARRQTSHASREPDFLSWRFAADSQVSYRCVIENVGSNSVFIAFKDVSVGRSTIRIIVDFFSSQPTTRLQRAQVACRLRKYVDAILISGNPCNGEVSSWLGAPFIRVPGKLLPQKLPFYLWKGGEGLSPDLENQIKLAYLTLSDTDVF